MAPALPADKIAAESLQLALAFCGIFWYNNKMRRQLSPHIPERRGMACKSRTESYDADERTDEKALVPWLLFSVENWKWVWVVAFKTAPSDASWRSCPGVTPP